MNAPQTYADCLAAARIRQAGAGFSHPLLRVSVEELARADADIEWALIGSRKRREGGEFKLTAYGLERISA